MNRRATLARLLGLAGALSLPNRPLPAFAQTRGEQVVAGRRVALVLGNTAYNPTQQSIPSSRKNAADVAEALTSLGFEVRREVDQGAQLVRSALQEFFAKVKSTDGPPPLGLLYYTGHGIQYKGENYLVPSDVNLSQGTDGIARSAINIDEDVIKQASLPNDGTCALIFDACRNDPTRIPGSTGGSFNQVNPPRGTVICFSTAPGKFAIAPRSPDENSIYTAILVEELKKANADISIKDFLDAVKFRVKRFMESSPDKFLRTHAQDPEVAANLRLRMSFAIEKLEKKLEKPPVDDAEEKAWAQIDQAVVPAERVKLLKDFLDKFPKSRFAQAAQVQLERAVLSEAATQRNRVQIDTSVGDAEYRSDQAKALDGDKDAAYRVAQMFERGSNGVPVEERRMVQWLRHASELKNGIASYRLYQYYVKQGLDRDAVRYETRAKEQGYVLPERLATTR
jgi:hypothetical protein